MRPNLRKADHDGVAVHLADEGLELVLAGGELGLVVAGGNAVDRRAAGGQRGEGLLQAAGGGGHLVESGLQTRDRSLGLLGALKDTTRSTKFKY